MDRSAGRTASRVEPARSRGIQPTARRRARRPCGVARRAVRDRAAAARSLWRPRAPRPSSCSCRPARRLSYQPPARRPRLARTRFRASGPIRASEKGEPRLPRRPDHAHRTRTTPSTGRPKDPRRIPPATCRASTSTSKTSPTTAAAHQNVDSVATQYSDAAGEFANYNSHFAGRDRRHRPVSRQTAAKQATICLTDEQLQDRAEEIRRSNTACRTGLEHEYFILTPPESRRLLRSGRRSNARRARNAPPTAPITGSSTPNPKKKAR